MTTATVATAATAVLDPVLDAHGLTKSFDGQTVLCGVDLQVHEGEFISVMGPSGSGKSTLLYNISGMDTMTAGEVHFAGEELGSLTQKQLARLRLTTMGFIFQHVYLLKNLCLLDNVVLPAYLAGLAPREELNERALALMERTGVAELADRDVTEASGGQLQRIGICRALINQPRILFGDEPTGALDSTAAAEIMAILRELNAEGTTIMVVTHDAKVATQTARVLYMLDGRIVADRDLGPFTGVGLEQRHAELTAWLLEQEQIAQLHLQPRSRGAVVTGPERAR
jgi:putative ABC transport system ATP-binding protein